jgi:hypothetical protein
MDSSETACRISVGVERVLGVIVRFSFSKRILPPDFQAQFTPAGKNSKEPGRPANSS